MNYLKKFVYYNWMFPRKRTEVAKMRHVSDTITDEIKRNVCGYCDVILPILIEKIGKEELIKKITK